MQVSGVFICCMPQVEAAAIKYAKIHITDASFSNFPRADRWSWCCGRGGGGVERAKRQRRLCLLLLLQVVSFISLYWLRTQLPTYSPYILLPSSHVLLLSPLWSRLFAAFAPSRCAYLGDLFTNCALFSRLRLCMRVCLCLRCSYATWLD